MAKMNKVDLIDTFADKAHLSKKEANFVLDALIDSIKEGLIKGEEVNISNFGVFTLKVRSPRKGTSPSTHEIISIGERKNVGFRASKHLKGLINN